MRTLIYYIIKQNRLSEPIAKELGKKKETLQAQILRGNPAYDERMRITDSFRRQSSLDIHPVKLWSPIRKDQVHLYIQN